MAEDTQYSSTIDDPKVYDEVATILVRDRARRERAAAAETEPKLPDPHELPRVELPELPEKNRMALVRLLGRAFAYSRAGR